MKWPEWKFKAITISVLSNHIVSGVLECLKYRYKTGSAILLMVSRAHVIRYQTTSMLFLQNVSIPSTEDAEMQQQKLSGCKKVPEKVLNLVVFQWIFISNSSPKSTTA